VIGDGMVHPMGLFEHPLAVRPFTAGERAWIIYVVEEMKRLQPKLGVAIVSISDGFDIGREAMVYLLAVRWNFPRGKERFQLGRSHAEGTGLTPGEALEDLLAKLT
jgi:hypothetical protein